MSFTAFSLRVSLGLALPGILLLSSTLLMTYLQPASAGDPQGALLPTSDCRVSCFFGIRPDMMGLDDAMQALLADPRILSARLMSFGPSTIQTIEATIAPQERLSRLRLVAQADGVESVMLYGSGVKFTDIFLMLGPPDFVILDRSARSVTYTGFYPLLQIVTQVTLPICELHVAYFWQTDHAVSLTLFSVSKYHEHQHYFSTAPRSNDGWRQALSEMKQEACAGSRL